ncbi:hypothetical protein AALP_AAs45876U000100 [Arabis alpina]|uniref:Uncharacterized protein n=1 Tax=Arabis alpina TaxID=50452 RepID=A0A087G2F1_ARAAL|nr:hypothetical protein AALP_AAs45876U000100 [Arabis alpina]
MTTSSAFGFFPPSIQSSACSTRRCASSPVNFNRLGSLCLFDLRISPSMVNTVELSTLLRSASSTSPSRILETMVMVVARPPPPPLPPDPPDLLLSPPSNSSPQVKLHHFPELLSSSLASRALHRSLSDLLALTRLPSAVKLHLRRLSPEPPIDLNGTRSGWFLVTIRRTTTPPRSSHTIRTLPRPAGLPRSPSAVPGTVSSGKDPPSQSVPFKAQYAEA